MIRLIFMAPAVLLLTACAETTDSGLDSGVYKQTLGPAIIASFNEMCGATRIDEFRQSYLTFAGMPQPLNDAQQAEILGWFDRVRYRCPKPSTCGSGTRCILHRASGQSGPHRPGNRGRLHRDDLSYAGLRTRFNWPPARSRGAAQLQEAVHPPLPMLRRKIIPNESDQYG